MALVMAALCQLIESVPGLQGSIQESSYPSRICAYTYDPNRDATFHEGQEHWPQ